MPIYEYGCDQCGQIMEVWAKISDPPPATCATCGAGAPRKLVSRTAFHLKGGGWYAQGYGGSGATAKAGSSAGESSGSSTSAPASSTPSSSGSTSPSTPPSTGGTSGPSSAT